MGRKRWLDGTTRQWGFVYPCGVSVYDYFRQQFAQVTNTADRSAAREAIAVAGRPVITVPSAMSLKRPADPRQPAILSSPVISPAKWRTRPDEFWSAQALAHQRTRIADAPANMPSA